MQFAIVIVIVAVALLYLVYRKLGPAAKGQVPSCCCGCSGCAPTGGCGEPDPHVLRPKAGSAPDNSPKTSA